MALSTRTWDDLVGLIGAMTGINPASRSEEVGHIKHLVNLAASRAYRSHKFWERYLVAGEPRTLNRGYIAFEEDSFHVYGAGTDEVNGLYKRNGTANGNPRYSKYQADGTSIDWDLEYDGSANWELLVGAGHETLVENTVYYTVASTASTPPTTGWALDTGTTPAPALVDVAKIDTFFTVHVDGFPLDGSGGWKADKIVSSRGCYVETGNSPATEVYVTYKAALEDTYGDGTGGTTTDIPEEFFDYIALYVSRQMQIAKGTANGSPYAAIASREVEAVLEDEHMKIEHQGIVDSLGRQIDTGILNTTMLS